MSAVPVCEMDATEEHSSRVSSFSARVVAFLQSKIAYVLLVSSLILSAAFIVPGINRGELNINVSDEAFNATTGIYFADFFRDLPLRHPVQYTYEYYAQYPALGLIHWPPLFHVVESGLFLVFGPSVTASRLTVLLFALVGLAFWFRLVADLDNIWTAAVSTLTLAALPVFLLYERAAMLEIPSLALCIGALFYWVRYIKTAQSRDAYCFALVSVLALLTKQQSIFVAPAALFALIAARKWNLIFARATMGALAVCAVLSAPFYVLSIAVDTKSVEGNLRQGLQQGGNPLFFYPRALPSQLGWMLLILSLAGGATWFWWKTKKSLPVMFAWILGWYLTFTLIATKDDRYLIYCLPPFIYFAVAPIVAYVQPRISRQTAVALIAIVLVVNSAFALQYERPYVSGYRLAAEKIIKTHDFGVVLFDGDLSGDFIFFMRAEDPSRRFVVLRKALYVTRVMPQFGKEELVHSKGELDAALKEYGVQYVVLETGGSLAFNSQKILRDYLKDSTYKLVETVPITSNMREWNGRSLQIYRNAQAGPPTSTVLRLRMLSIGHDIVVPLDRYARGH